jgi:hypothetical protein
MLIDGIKRLEIDFKCKIQFRLRLHDTQTRPFCFGMERKLYNGDVDWICKHGVGAPSMDNKMFFLDITRLSDVKLYTILLNLMAFFLAHRSTPRDGYEKFLRVYLSRS